MALALRTFALILSLYGLCRYAMRRLNLPVEAALPFTAASVGVVVTLAGMLNVMREAVYLLFAAGLALAVISMWRRHESPLDVITPGTGFMLAACLLLGWLLHGARFVNYDDFSHWALIARTLLRSDALPTFRDTALSFLNYPPGSACWVYFFCRLTSTGEGAMMFAQAFFMLCMMLPLFLLAPRRPVWTVLAAAALGGYVYLSAGALTLTLYVDQLLPLVAACGMLLALLHARDSGRAALLALPFALYAYLVKNSGILFALLLGALVAGCAVWNARRGRRLTRRQWQAVCGMCLAPVLTLYLWNRHTTMVHVAASATKHAMRPGQLLSTFQEKTARDITDILQAFVSGVADFMLLPLLCLLAVALCLLLARFFARPLCRPLLYGLCGCAAAYLLYLGGLLLMYLFSMPTGEALSMASLNRYMTTILYWLAYAAAAAALLLVREAPRAKTQRRVIALSMAIFAAVYLSAAGFPDPSLLTARRNYPASERAQIEAHIRKQAIPTEGRYVLLSMRDTGISYYIFQYLLNPALLTMNLEHWNEVDAVIVYDPKPLELTYLNETVLASPNPPVVYHCEKTPAA